MKEVERYNNLVVLVQRVDEVPINHEIGNRKSAHFYPALAAGRVDVPLAWSKDGRGS